MIIQQVYETAQKNVEDKLLTLLLGIHTEPAELENFRALLRCVYIILYWITFCNLVIVRVFFMM